ncbi:24382_t:CDS:2 [Racocetra persica]|uniref:24382_t:CDS:1 n=1 Tax=Racocetra persica TaxID=160502 RepID=A0ACA9MC50_9GLOM|nr:24382_t:CDS:2 [Racocetra persica]
MSQSKPQIPIIGSEFLTVEQFKEAAQQGAKGIQSIQQAKGSHRLKKAKEAASSLEQVFSHIDRAFHQYKLQTNRALGLNLVFANPFILNNKRFDQLIGKFSNKALYELEKKYESLSDCRSKTTFLYKIEALAAEKIIVPKVPLHVVTKRRPISTKQDLFLSPQQEYFLYHDQVPVYMHKYTKDVIHVNKDGNCSYKAVAVSLGRSENEWLVIRKELKKELNEREQFYQSLVLANDDYETIIKEIA